MSRRPIVGGNWKCNPDSMKKLDELIANINACDTKKCDVYVCPSTLHVPYVIPKIKNRARVTPQDCNATGCGAYTGSMALPQMKDLKMVQVMIGHSERRGEFGIYKMDDDATLAAKLKAILDAGMSCIYCLGEPKEVREKGLDATLELCDKQMKQIYSMLDPKKVVLAYEPVWAIGTGLTATPADAQATHKGIRDLIAKNASPEVAAKIRIQYGGSANAKNAPELSAQPDIDGFLVGGASLKPEFTDIVKAIAEAKNVKPAREKTEKVKGKKAKKVFDYSGLEKGMRLQVESDGKYYAAEVVQVSESKNRAKAPVKISYKGYVGYDEFVGGDRIKCKALKVKTEAPEEGAAEKKGPSPAALRLRGKCPEGGSQAHMTFTCPPELEEKGAKMWEAHAAWMKKTHVSTGDNAILFYHVCKGKEIDDAAKGPKGTPTGNVVWTCAEFYKTKAGLDNHFAMFHAGHECGDFGALFQELMGTGKCKFEGTMYGETFSSIAASELQRTYDGFKP